MPGVNVGVNLTGIIDLFRGGNDLEIYRKMEPAVLQDVTSKLKPAEGPPDYGGAEQAVFKAMMDFRQQGGSEKAVGRIFAPLIYSVKQHEIRNQQQAKMLMENGDYEVGTPGTPSALYAAGLPLQRRRSLMDQIYGGSTMPSAPPPQMSPVAGLGNLPMGQAEPGQVAPEAPPLLPQQAAPARTMNRPDIGTSKGQKQLMVDLTNYLMDSSISKQNREQATTMLTNLKNLASSSTSNVEYGQPKFMWDSVSKKMVPVVMGVNKETGQISSNYDTSTLQEEDPNKKTVTQGNDYEDEQGNIFRQQYVMDNQGNMTVRQVLVGKGLKRPGRPGEAKQAAGEDFIKNFEQQYGPQPDEWKNNVRMVMSPSGEKIVKHLQDQMQMTSKAITDIEKSKAWGTMQNSENPTPQETKLKEKYDALQAKLKADNDKLMKFLDSLNIALEPPGSITPTELPTAGPTAQQGPGQQAAPDWLSSPSLVQPRQMPHGPTSFSSTPRARSWAQGVK